MPRCPKCGAGFVDGKSHVCQVRSLLWTQLFGSDAEWNAIVQNYDAASREVIQSQPTSSVSSVPVKTSPQSNAILICACGLLAAFFMPWVQFFGAGLSGYDLGQLGSYGNYAWVIPILSGATIFASLNRFNNRVIGAMTGIVPLIGILYGMMRLNQGVRPGARDGVIEIAGQVFAIGGWLTVLFSVAILIAAWVHVPDRGPSSGEPEAVEPLTNAPSAASAFVHAPATRHTDSISTELARLADLHSRGTIDADEFRAAKANCFHETGLTPLAAGGWRNEERAAADARALARRGLGHKPRNQIKNRHSIKQFLIRNQQ